MPKKIKKEYGNIKLNMIDPIWNDKLDLPNAVSDIQIYITYVIKKREILPISCPIYIYINIIKGRSLFKIMNKCKLRFQSPETMLLFGSTEKNNR